MNGKLISEAEQEISGLKWIELNFSYAVKNIPRHVCRRAVFFNNTFLAIDFVTLSSTELKDADSRNAFFDSFEITEEEAAIVQSSK